MRFFVALSFIVVFASCSFTPDPYQDVTLDLSTFGESRALSDGFSGAVGFFGPDSQYLSFFTNDYGGIGQSSFRYNVQNYSYPLVSPTSSIPNPYFPDGQYRGFLVDPGSSRVNLLRLPAGKNVRAVLHLYTDGSELVNSYGGFPGWGNSVTYKSYVSAPFDLLPFTPTVVDFRNAQPMGTYTVEYPAEVNLITTYSATDSDGTYPVENAVDTSNLTYWSSGIIVSGGVVSFRINFVEMSGVTSIKVSLGPGSGQAGLQRSTDNGSSWSNIGSSRTVMSEEVLETILTIPLRAQNVRVVFQVPSGGSVSIREFEVKGFPLNP